MLNNGEVPNVIKKGLLSPVFKKKGSKKLENYYRGIIVLPVINKIPEAIIKLRIQPQILKMQNPSQRGFTANTSPLNASFIIEELKRNAKDEKTPVITVLLDAKSAFDVVDLYHLLRRLYQTGINDKLWSLFNSLHQGESSVVKWMGHESSAFEVTQGVRQGGILSADLYKIYVNPLLDRLNHTGLGAKIGNIICNTSVCADDVTLNSFKSYGLWIIWAQWARPRNLLTTF
jgi:hypothetical protein